MQKLKHLKWHAMPEVGVVVVVALAVVALAMTLAPRRVQAKEVDYVSGATVVAQSSEGPEHPAAAVVDGSLETWWISDDMKAGQEAGQSQTPQWIVIDLGPSFSPSSVTSIAVDWRPNKVWGQAYRVETADGYDGDNTSWTTMARVERDAKGLINPQNADGQNIADGVRDTITASSTPALEDGATAHRYVRLYIEKVNEAAPGNNVNVCDLHIMGEVGPEEPGGLGRRAVERGAGPPGGGIERR
ncbi:discoidin domain-containing protein [Olsenella uli]|uniref:discoidin domain-containing protein n=1 Tax=Olsenella uli TaxID=133926 RepID=UPI001956489D|nr:discoidin domain-containing protein [Olsenella uli]MBM6816659.1 discoidin domain-containing protein [Olsenella uli]